MNILFSCFCCFRQNVLFSLLHLAWCLPEHTKPHERTRALRNNCQEEQTHALAPTKPEQTLHLTETLKTTSNRSQPCNTWQPEGPPQSVRQRRQAHRKTHEHFAPKCDNCCDCTFCFFQYNKNEQNTHYFTKKESFPANKAQQLA
jgi:hypothetical protein